jgi:hypothetical protein
MRNAVVAIALFAMLGMSAWAQEKGEGRVENPVKAMTRDLNSPPVVCTLADGKELSVRYNRPSADRREELANGKVWPASASIFLFTSVALTIGDSGIPAGAFSLYFIPARDGRTLIVNKSVTEGAKYDETQDLLRTPMKIGELTPPATEVTFYFAYIAPKQCNMRLYYGKIGSWAEFTER